MSGRLQEISFSELREQQQSAQSSLNEYSDNTPTYIAVVREPRGNIRDIADEIWSELGMPEWALKRFLARRSGYRTNSAIEEPHNQAYIDMNMEAIYYNYLENSDEAQDRISDATERLISDENITLVCYEDGGDKCHRYMLMDRISERVESRENCKFNLSA